MKLHFTIHLPLSPVLTRRLLWVVAGAYLMFAATVANAATRYIVGASPNLSASAREAAYAQVASFALNDMNPGDSLELCDALNLRQITQLKLPDDPALTSTKMARERRLGPALRGVQSFFAAAPAATVTAAAAGRLLEPQFLALVGGQMRAQGEDLRIVLLGSPIYLDTRQLEFGFDGGFYPSDAHLGAEAGTTPFSVHGQAKMLDGVAVYHAWCMDGEFTSDAHEKGVARFWNLYVGQQGGALAAYAADPATVFERLRRGVRTPLARVEPDAGQTKVEMIRRLAVSNRRDDWIAMDRVSPAAPLTEPVVQALRLGVRWREPVDVDIYAASRGNPDLYFGRSRTAEGVHVKDYLTAPPPNGNTFETIEFNRPVDVRQVSAALNLYSGRPNSREGVSVEVRVWAGEGKVYTRSLSIPCTEGNNGRNSAERANDPHWVVLDLARICGLH